MVAHVFRRGGHDDWNTMADLIPNTPGSEHAPDAPRVWTRRDVIIRAGGTAALAGLGCAAAIKLYDPQGRAGLQPPPPIRLKDYFEKVDFPVASPRISAAFGTMDQIDQMVRAAVGG